MRFGIFLLSTIITGKDTTGTTASFYNVNNEGDWNTYPNVTLRLQHTPKSESS